MKQRTIEKKRAIAGWVFIAPWLCGIVLFFIQPLISLVRYSVTDFQFMQEQGSMFAPLEGGWWENYRTAFQGDALFPQKFTATLLDMLYRVPVILIFSLFVAIVLNQKFKGRGFMRLIFFLPVLVTTGVISSIIKTSLTTVVVGGDSATNIFSAALLTRQLLDAGLPEGLVNTVGGMIANVSDLVWSSGVQILVFLMGLLTIPQSHYEVAQVEGASGWETFWKITFPTVSPFVLATIVYTIIDSFTSYDNQAMRYIRDYFMKDMNYSYAAAMAWMYFLLVLIILGLVVLLCRRMLFQKER
jgi:ABC-type sugar transport system permease subunit